MSQAAGGKSRRMSKKKQRALRNRRIAAAVVAALAVALGVVVFRSGMGVGSILMGAAVAPTTRQICSPWKAGKPPSSCPT